MYYPSLEEVKKYSEEGDIIPIYREVVADLETPVSAFLKIRQDGCSFLLESVEGGQRLARYSFIGAEPYKVIATKGKDKEGPLEQIAGELSGKRIVPMGDLPRFCGGAVGYLSYETINRFEDIPQPECDPMSLPESFFMFVDTMLVFDHVTHKIKVMSLVSLKGDIAGEYNKAVEKIEALISRLNEPLKPAKRNDAPAGSRQNGTVVSNFSKKEFKAAVETIKRYITEGEAIQVVLSQRMAKRTDIEPFEIYRALRSINPSPYMFFLDFVDFQIVGASPEVLVRVEDGVVMTRPLAGTRPRGGTQEEDAALEQELRNDEKEKAEHIMLVDLGRNDIGRVSEPGSVELRDLMDVERYSHVMHLVTHVEGTLRRDLTAFDALGACFPAGTVSGAPKIRAMEIIAELEPDKRGPYAGAAGYFSFTGNMDMAIAIRTMVVKDGTVYVQAGCGIVYDSVPEREYEETLNKAMAQLKAIDQAENRQIKGNGEHAVID
jgi:anthranilate synthase component 1